MKLTKKHGFTLIELMIVVAVIAIIAAIAIPNLLRSRMSANEASAAGSMRTLSSSEAAFQAAALIDADNNGEGDYGTLDQLANPPQGPAFIDEVLGAGQKQGYDFDDSGVNDFGNSYSITAAPTTPGRTGVRTYYVDESGVIRFDGTGAAADANSTPLG